MALNSIGGNATVLLTTANAVFTVADETGASHFDITRAGAVTKVNNVAVTITAGSATPEAAVTAPIGSIYLRSGGGAGTSLYVKESGAGNTGWVAK